MAKWSMTFEEGDEVTLKGIDMIERLGNRLLDLATTAMPLLVAEKRLAQNERNAALSARRAEGLDTVTHASGCECRFCHPIPEKGAGPLPGLEEEICRVLRQHGIGHKVVPEPEEKL